MPTTTARISADPPPADSVKEDYLGVPAAGCRYWQIEMAAAVLWLDGAGATDRTLHCCYAIKPAHSRSHCV